MTSTTIRKRDDPSRFPSSGNQWDSRQEDSQGFDETAGMKHRIQTQSRYPIRSRSEAKPITECLLFGTNPAETTPPHVEIRNLTQKTMAIPNVPIEDRLAFWKFRNATSAFEQVSEICKILISEHIEDGHPLHIPLQTSLHIYYGKPFKNPKVSFIDNIVPPEFSEVHSSLIMMRDKIYAHTDSNGPLTPDDVALNKVTVHIRDDKVIFATALLFPRLIRIQQIHVLAQMLAEKTDDHATQIWEKHMQNESVSSGDYSVNLEPGDNPFFVPLNWGGNSKP